MARKRAYPVEEPVPAASSKDEEFESSDSGGVKFPPPKLHKSLSRDASHKKKKKKKKKKKQRLKPSNKPLCSSASEEKMKQQEDSEGAKSKECSDDEAEGPKDKECSDDEAEGAQENECSDEEAEGAQEKECSDAEAEGAQVKECSHEEAEGAQEKECSHEEAEGAKDKECSDEEAEGAKDKQCSDEEVEGAKDKECSDEEVEGAKGKGCSDEESEEEQQQSFSDGLGKSDNPLSHDSSEENMKMASKDADKEREESRRNPFQRVWSDDDVIALLQGVIDYTSKEGKTPSEDRAAFGSFINEFISFDATKVQVSEKIRGLKEKYQNSVLRGKNKIFATDHDQKVFELSEKIWGREGLLSEEQVYSLRSHKKSKMVRGLSDEPAENENNDKTGMLKMIEVHKQLAGPSIDSSFIEKGLDMIDHAKRAELENKWQKLEIEQWELYEKRLGLIREQGFCILEAMKSG